MVSEQTPSGALRPSTGPVRRVLTIDGGGIKGVFAASFLAELEKTLGEPLVDHFDLISGTSTGGIIALGLGMGLSAAEILSFYESHGPKIFGKGAPFVSESMDLGKVQQRTN